MSNESWLSRLFGRKREGEPSPPPLTTTQRPPEREAEYRDLCDRGQQELAAGRYVEALARFERALGIDPGDSDLWYNKGVALHELGRYAEELACYDRGLEIDPRGTRLWARKGLGLALLARYKEAIACYDRGLEIDPREDVLWAGRGRGAGEAAALRGGAGLL
jgi:tetratricopeptide (TPR) repeat protein